MKMLNMKHLEEENIEVKYKEKPVGPPLELEIPLHPPPARLEKMNMIIVSNIMGIAPKPFDPKIYVEEDTFVTDEYGSKKRIHLENNIVHWRTIRNSADMTSRYGPPPSYPHLKIPSLNAPIPLGAIFGYHPGGWGKPPVDEFGHPLYGDVFGVQYGDVFGVHQQEQPNYEVITGQATM